MWGHRMGAELTSRETGVLYGILGDTGEDAILKLDCDGFLLHASPLENLGLSMPRKGGEQLFAPHVADFAEEPFKSVIRTALADALQSPGRGRPIEFRVGRDDASDRWFELRLGALRNPGGRCYGALGIVRNIDDRKFVEQRSFESAATDSMTGLPNRGALLSRMETLLASGILAHLAVFDIDHFRQINMAQGQKAGDRVLQRLAQYLQSMLRPADVVARIGGESFAIVLPETNAAEAEAICRRLVASLGDCDLLGGTTGTAVTMSAGLARVDKSIDDTMKRGELALFQAKARGRNRLETEERLARTRSA